MAEISREGHRQRVKSLYVQNGLNAMPDHQVLELLLFYAIPRKDVKEIAYALLNHFGGDLNAVLQANVRELTKVKGIGENAAILLSTYGNVYERMNVRKNRNVKCFHNYLEEKEYVANLLHGLAEEQVVMITMDNAGTIIKTHSLAQGSVCRSEVSVRELITKALDDKATMVLLAHNHPKGDCLPSEDDASFTISCHKLLATIGVRLQDHIIVGETNTLSLANDTRYAYMFD